MLGALTRNKPEAIEDALREFERVMSEDANVKDETGLLVLAKSQKERLETKDRMEHYSSLLNFG